MKAISRRIGRLEKKLAPQTDSPRPSMVEILRERRRRRLEAEGERLEEPPPMPIPVGAGRPRSLVEILIYGRRLEVLQEVASGKLSPGEGRNLADLIESRRQILETEELEKRVRALEQLPESEE